MRSPVRVVALFLACLALSGCADKPAAGAPTASAAPAPVASAPPAAADLVQRPARHEVACLDRTASLPAWFLERALGHIAARVENAVTGPMEPAVFHLRSTIADSSAPEAQIRTVELLAVPTAPRPPPHPGDGRALAAYEQKRVQWEAGVEAGRTVARAYAARIRELDLPVDHSGTDVVGCVLHATDLLGSTGERHLFIASDLVGAGRQEDGGPAPGTLLGVQVTVMYCCADGPACADRVAAFVDVLERAGARDVVVGP